jgi:hypothetical protein
MAVAAIFAFEALSHNLNGGIWISFRQELRTFYLPKVHLRFHPRLENATTNGPLDIAV